MSEIRNDKSLLSKRLSFASEHNPTENLVSAQETALKKDILELKQEIASIQRTIADQSDRAATTSINECSPLARSSPKYN